MIVASDAYKFAAMNYADVQLKRGWGSFKSYAQSKLANIIHSYELAKRLEGSGISVYSLHPGKRHD